MKIIGIILTILGVGLTIWSLWYAKQQSKLVTNAHRNEMISLWAFLDRVRTLLFQMETNGLKNGEIDEEKLEVIKSKVLPQLFKGLCDHYVMVAKMIVQKTPDISLNDVDRWVEINRLKTDWQKSQFINLVEAANSVKPKENKTG